MNIETAKYIENNRELINDHPTVMSLVLRHRRRLNSVGIDGV